MKRKVVPLIEEIDFTPREEEILDLMAVGLSYKLIASTLKISPHTAKFHIQNIIWKLNAESGTHVAVMWAVHRALKANGIPRPHCDRCARLVELASQIVEAEAKPTTIASVKEVA